MITPLFSTQTDGAEISAAGAILARGVIAKRLANFQGGVRLLRGQLSYSRASGTFLLGGMDNSLPRQVLELNQHGVSLGTLVVESDAPVIASHGVAPQWLAGTPTGTRYIIGTSTPFGGSDARLPDCITPDPFVALGGGRCVNGGWYPPGS